jgi:ubiquinone/menaquinone biosynthesis C-methylase UbiE
MMLEESREDNVQKFLERKALYLTFGYDIDKERDFVLDQAQPFQGRILEAGTGKGHFTLTLARAGYRVVTFDISPDEQYYANLLIGHAGLGTHVDFMIEDAQSLSFNDRSFDTIFSVNVIHHLSRPYQALDELMRILANEGKLVIADFNSKGFEVIAQIHASEGRLHGSGQITLDKVKEYLDKQGFMIKDIQSIFQRVLVAEKRMVTV